MARRTTPDWRNQAAADLLIRHLPGLELPNPVLVMEDPFPDVPNALRDTGREIKRWNRRAYGGEEATPWPPLGPFGAAAFRLPRGKEELVMGLHAAASVLEPGGSLLVYGANDEGIRAALGPLGGLCPGADTSAVGNRCRVLKGVWGSNVSGLKGELEEWKSTISLDHPDLPSKWISYPGIFAHGRLDQGTRLLLSALPKLPKGARILDYGCGSGPVSYLARTKGEALQLHMLDVDSVALEAAGENVPEGRILLRDGLPSGTEGRFDAILSNPPFHRGKAEDPGMILSLIQGAPRLLHSNGLLVFVSQRRLSLEGALLRQFKRVTMVAEDPAFRVWKGQGPKKGVT